MTDIVYNVVRALTKEEYSAVWKSEVGIAHQTLQECTHCWWPTTLAFANIKEGDQVTYRCGTPEARDAAYIAQRRTETPSWYINFIFRFHPNGDITITRVDG